MDAKKPILGNPRVEIGPFGKQDILGIKEDVEEVWGTIVSQRYAEVLDAVIVYYGDDQEKIDEWKKKSEEILLLEKENSIKNGFMPLVILLPEI